MCFILLSDFVLFPSCTYGIYVLIYKHLKKSTILAKNKIKVNTFDAEETAANYKLISNSYCNNLYTYLPLGVISTTLV